MDDGRTIQEASDWLGVSESTVRRWIRDGELEARKTANGWLIDARSLEEPSATASPGLRRAINFGRAVRVGKKRKVNGLRTLVEASTRALGGASQGDCTALLVEARELIRDREGSAPSELDLRLNERFADHQRALSGFWEGPTPAHRSTLEAEQSATQGLLDKTRV